MLSVRWWVVACGTVVAIVYASQADLASVGSPPHDRCASTESDLRDAFYKSQWNFEAGRRNTEQERLQAAAWMIQASERLCRESEAALDRGQRATDQALPQLRQILNR